MCVIDWQIHVVSLDSKKGIVDEICIELGPQNGVTFFLVHVFDNDQEIVF